MEETYTFSRARESNMSKKIIIGASVVLVGVILVIGLAVGLVYGLKDDMTYDQQIRLTMDEEDHSKHCCKRLRITGTTNQDDFYQEMMGDYVIYKDYPQLDFTKDPAVAHDVAKHVFPVYTHAMFENDPEVKTAKFAYLYFYYNTEPRKTELECPEGCWIISMYDMTPNNYWYGRKFYYLKKAPGVTPPLCPDSLSAKGDKFINQQGEEDQGLKVECAE